MKNNFFPFSDKRRAAFSCISILFFLIATSFTGFYLYAAETIQEDCETIDESEPVVEEAVDEDSINEDFVDDADKEESLIGESPDDEITINDDEYDTAYYPTEDIPAIEFRGTLVFVIDDAGNSLYDLEPFLNFPGAITIAVLPGLPNSIESARRIREAGKEVFLHQPMESIGGRNPGPGAIYTGMEREEIREIINRNLDELWPVAGMNNHEGSRVSMDEEIMEIILEICQERGIVYLDSRTTALTTAPEVASRMEINIAQRDIFIDNEQNLQSFRHYINLGLERAERQGSAVMLGHTWSDKLGELLIELYSELIEQGYTFSTASQIINNIEP